MLCDSSSFAAALVSHFGLWCLDSRLSLSSSLSTNSTLNPVESLPRSATQPFNSSSSSLTPEHPSPPRRRSLLPSAFTSPDLSSLRNKLGHRRPASYSSFASLTSQGGRVHLGGPSPTPPPPSGDSEEMRGAGPATNNASSSSHYHDDVNGMAQEELLSEQATTSQHDNPYTWERPLDTVNRVRSSTNPRVLSSLFLAFLSLSRNGTRPRPSWDNWTQTSKRAGRVCWLDHLRRVVHVASCTGYTHHGPSPRCSRSVSIAPPARTDPLPVWAVHEPPNRSPVTDSLLLSSVPSPSPSTFTALSTASSVTHLDGRRASRITSALATTQRCKF